jgi:O-antigen/teichoic acid export membrane protein
VKKTKALGFLRRLLIKRQSLWSLGGNGVSAFAGLLLFAISSSRLSTADFGIWVIFQTASTLLDMFRTGLLFPGYLQLSAGKTKVQRRNIFNSVELAFIAITLAQSVLCWILMVVVPSGSSWHFFFMYYPWILLSGSVVTLAEWWFQSNVRFQNILFLRGVHRVVLLAVAFFFVFDLQGLIYVQAGTNILCAMVVVSFFRLPGIRFEIVRAHASRLFHFGKYATPSQMLSNLLRSSDTLMISAAMGSAATGVYGAAAKFLEFVELPIRSFGAVHFNHLAKLANVGRHDEAIRFAKQRVMKTTLRVVPVALFLGVFAPQLILHISGSNYSASIPVLRVMAVYCLLIPADRYCGLLLESFARPELNLIKVFVMLTANVVGNGIAILFFNTPLSIAASSIVTFSVGVLFGIWLILTKALPQQQRSVSFKVAIPQN